MLRILAEDNRMCKIATKNSTSKLQYQSHIVALRLGACPDLFSSRPVILGSVPMLSHAKKVHACLYRAICVRPCYLSRPSLKVVS